TAAQVAQFTDVKAQLDTIAGDSGYKGVNLLTAAGTVTANFNEAGTSNLTMTGFDASSTGLAIGTLGLGNNGAALNTLETGLNTALDTLRDKSAVLASNLSILQTRVDYTTDMVNTLTAGANKLTAADTNEEGANMLLLQTRQQLGTTSLSIASQAAQSVMRLF
ncbi:MAG: flagellin, partial [Planctomycetes bacterium]|nr:flagellin [Planctomycetota bacterium]